jgi:arylsulfatase A-like enzyme
VSVRLRVLVAIVVLASVACDRPTTGPPRRQALLIVLDAARADRFSGYGYGRETTPRLDELGRDGRVFTRFFSAATYTRAALSSLFYSRYFARPLIPASPEVAIVDPDELFRSIDAEAISLPRALSSAGIWTAALSAHSWITPSSDLAKEFDEFHDLSAELHTGRDDSYPDAERVVDRALEWLDAHRDRDFFLYLHLMDTHFPHPFGADARSFFGGDARVSVAFDSQGRPKRQTEALTGPARAYLDALYDGGLHAVDRQLGRLFDRLSARHRLESMVVAVTADHGEQLLEQPARFGHGGPWRDLLARIPFILYAPSRVAPGRIEELAEMVDVAPTLLALLGVALPPGKRVDGIDVSATPSPRRHVFMAQGIRSERFKALLPEPEAIFHEPPPSFDAVDGELYDLVADPAETVNLWRAQPEVGRELLATFRAHMSGPYARYRDAKATGPPSSAFAIASQTFTLIPPLTPVPERPTMRSLMDAVPAGGWIRCDHPGRYGILGTSMSQPLAIEFPLPNGAYAVSVALHGGATIESPGRSAFDVRSPGPNATGPPHGFGDLDTVSLGEVTISDGRFRATVRPLRDMPWIFLRRFGFAPPVESGRADDAASREREHRLRALGYTE